MPGLQKDIYDEGRQFPSRRVWDFRGDGVTLTDDSDQGRTRITIAGATGRNYQYDVRDYGLVEGGVVDNTTAMNTLITTIKDTQSGQGSATIFIPRGKWLFNGTINLDQTLGFMLLGEGAYVGGTQLIIGQTSGSGDFISAKSSTFLRLRNLFMDGSTSGWTGAILRLGHISSAIVNQPTIEDCWFNGFFTANVTGGCTHILMDGYVVVGQILRTTFSGGMRAINIPLPDGACNKFVVRECVTANQWLHSFRLEGKTEALKIVDHTAEQRRDNSKPGLVEAVGTAHYQLTVKDSWFGDSTSVSDEWILANTTLYGGNFDNNRIGTGTPFFRLGASGSAQFISFRENVSFVGTCLNFDAATAGNVVDCTITGTRGGIVGLKKHLSVYPENFESNNTLPIT